MQCNGVAITQRLSATYRAVSVACLSRDGTRTAVAWSAPFDARTVKVQFPEIAGLKARRQENGGIFDREPFDRLAS